MKSTSCISIKRMNGHSRKQFKLSITKTVLELIVKKTSQNFEDTEIRELVDSNQSISRRIFWAVILFLAFFACCYQIIDRLNYYFDYPKAVDIHIDAMESLKPPILKFCSSESQYMKEIFEQDSGITVCMLPLFAMFEITNKTINLTRAWDFPNESIIFKDVKSLNYEFLSTPKDACDTDEEFQTCYDKCIFSTIKQSTTCSFPFSNPQLGYAQCDSSNLSLAKTNFFNNVKDILIPKVFSHCNCRKPCQHLILEIRPSLYRLQSRDLTLGVRLDNILISFTERIAYDKISLLSDIGGNLGLFLGWSVLSITEILQKIILYIKINHTNVKKSKNRHQQTSIARWIDEEIIKQYKMQEKLEKNTDIVLKISKLLIRLIIVLACVTLMSFMIYHRVSYYSMIPLRNVVKVETTSTATYPTMFVCGVGEKLVFFKQKYAKKSKTGIDWCDVDMIDLYKFKPKFNFEYIWNLSKITTVPPSITLSAIESFTSLRLITPNVTEVYTHGGLCNRYDFLPQDYLGIFTIFPIPFFTLGQTLKIHSCKNPVFYAYFGNNGSHDIDLLSAVDFPVHASTANDIRMTVAKRMNTKYSPCIEKTQHEACKKQCFIKHLQLANLCRLPFLSTKNLEKELSECKDIPTAKDTYKKYMNVSASLSKLCPCIRPCNQIFLTINSYSIVQEPGEPFGMTLAMSGNIIQHVIEVEDYSVFALCGDVGNSLGLALGISVIALARYLFQFYQQTKSFLISLV